MTLIIKTILLLVIFIMGFLANRLENHLKPTLVVNPLLFNIGKIISYFVAGIIIGLLGFLVKINGYAGGVVLIIFAISVFIVTISHLPFFPKIVIIGLQSHHHPKKSLKAGLINIFSSSASLHIIMLVTLAHGYFIESGFILLTFALGTLYFPGKKYFAFNKTYKVLQFILFLVCTLFITQKGLLYTEKYLFSPFEDSKTAVVPETLNNIQYLKSNISELNNRIIISKDYELNWMIQGEENYDSIFIPRFRYKSRLDNNYQSLVINADKKGLIYFTGFLGRGDYIMKVVEGDIDVYNLPYNKVLDSGYGDDIHGEGYIADQNIPDIEITDPGIAKIENGTQFVDIKITETGYIPSVILLKKGIPAVINFKGDNLTEKNRRIIMPSYNEYLEFVHGDNPINIPDPLIDFIFYSWKGEFGGYILIVDELEGMTKEKVDRQIRMFNVNGI